MLTKFKKMKEQNIFKIIPSAIDIDSIIDNAQSDEDIINHFDDIKMYIKDLSYHLNNNNTYITQSHISDFYDKFTFELYNLYLAPTNTRNNIYQKEVSYGKAGNITIGIKGEEVKFTLEERKLIKLINYYYISMKDEELSQKIIYIPMKQLENIFSNGINKAIKKELLVETCNKLNSKYIYWNFKKTKYKKRLELKSLDFGKEEQIFNIAIVYQPWGKNDISINGIICEVNNFLKLRYSLKQISNDFPLACLQDNYLTFSITDKLLYYINMSSNKKSLNIDLTTITNQIYGHKDNQCYQNYNLIMKNDTHKPREQVNLLKAISKASEYFNSSNKWKLELVINNIEISLLDCQGKAKAGEDIYNDIILIISNPNKKDTVKLIEKKCQKLEENILKNNIDALFTNLKSSNNLKTNQAHSYFTKSLDNQNKIDICVIKDLLIADNNLKYDKRQRIFLERSDITIKVYF